MLASNIMAIVSTASPQGDQRICELIVSFLLPQNR